MDTLKDGLRRKLVELAALDGVSGREGPVVSRLREAMAPWSDRVELDRMGNLFAYRRGSGPGPVLMIAAHSDEIGAMVRSIEPSGYIRFQKIGGTQDALLPARKVTVGGHLGVIGVKAGHLQTARERTEVRPAAELYIDVGAGSAEEVAALGIKVGDAVAFRSELEFFSGGDRFVGKAVDNRLGCSVLWELFERLEGVEFAGTVVGAFTVQEEVGLKGATVAAFGVGPDLAVALDTMPAGDTPDVSFHRELPVSIGRGPVLQLASGAGGRGLLLNPIMERLIITSAHSRGLPLQTTVFEGGNTDAGAIHLVRAGVPCAPLTLPRRYSHSPVEVGDLNDAAACVLLLGTVVERCSEAMGWTFV
jgi:endoglucanase